MKIIIVEILDDDGVDKDGCDQFGEH